MPPDAGDILGEVAQQLSEGPSGPIMLTGLEQSVPSGRKDHPILEKLNLSRPQWPRRVARPVVFWIPDYLLGLLGRFAPDFLDWRSDTVHFPTLSENGIADFERMAISGGMDDSLPLELRMERVEELQSRIRGHAASSDPVTQSATVDWWLELANHVGALGRFHEAREYNQKALTLCEKLFNPDHPKVALCLNNLGVVLQDLGNLNEAKECYERALQIDEAANGPDHPKVAIRVNNLGSARS